MKSKTEILEIIDQMRGTEQYHKFSNCTHFPILTDGVLALANAAECFWLLDVIGSYQTNKKLDPNFQVWKLTVDHETHKGKVCAFNDATFVLEQDIPFTDFPLEELKLYLMRGVLLLPSEY